MKKIYATKEEWYAVRNARRREKYATDPAYRDKWKSRDKSKQSARKRVRLATDPAYRERIRLIKKHYYAKHGHVVNARRSEKLFLDRIAVVNVLTNGEGTCRWCGQGDVDVLCIDHINDDGAHHRKNIGTDTLTAWIIKNDYPPGFQVLCANCNLKKEVMRRRNSRKVTR